MFPSNWVYIHHMVSVDACSDFEVLMHGKHGGFGFSSIGLPAKPLNSLLWNALRFMI